MYISDLSFLTKLIERGGFDDSLIIVKQIIGEISYFRETRISTRVTL